MAWYSASVEKRLEISPPIISRICRRMVLEDIRASVFGAVSRCGLVLDRGPQTIAPIIKYAERSKLFVARNARRDDWNIERQRKREPIRRFAKCKWVEPDRQNAQIMQAQETAKVTMAAPFTITGWKRQRRDALLESRARIADNS